MGYKFIRPHQEGWGSTQNTGQQPFWVLRTEAQVRDGRLGAEAPLASRKPVPLAVYLRKWPGPPLRPNFYKEAQGSQRGDSVMNSRKQGLGRFPKHWLCDLTLRQHAWRQPGERAERHTEKGQLERLISHPSGQSARKTRGPGWLTTNTDTRPKTGASCSPCKRPEWATHLQHQPGSWAKLQRSRFS